MQQIYENLIQGLLDKGFASVDDWFSNVELDGLRKSLLARYEKYNFQRAGIGNKEHLKKVSAIRNDQILWLLEEFANDWEKQFFQNMEDFVGYLNRTCFTNIRESEFHYTVYEPGSFYKRHIDQFKNDTRRQFSFVGYLTDHWVNGDGGELLIYLGDQVEVIKPLPGRVVFFRSALEHEVLPTNIRRLSLTGWLKTV